MIWILKKIDSFVAWMFWLIVFFILGLGAVAMGVANYLIQKIRRHSGKVRNLPTGQAGQTPLDSRQAGMTGTSR